MTPAQALIAFGLLAAASIVGLVLDIRHANKERAEKQNNERRRWALGWSARRAAA